MLIGLSGKQGTGKSTIAKAIQMKYSNVKVFKIAGTLYELQDYIYERLGLTMVGEKDRPLLIALGLWGRSKDVNIWCNASIKAALAYSESGGIALIDDIRFPNEALGVQSKGILIRIEGLQRGINVNEELKNDTSETALDDFPFERIISNEQSVDIMIKQLNNILER
jgi:hypothetical protein